MAVTSIWAVHGDNVATVMKYIANQDKTDMGQFPAVASFHAVNRVLQYGADEMKTEQQLLVTGILCDTKPEIAARQFLSTKIHHGGKVGGIVCFHAYQSFKRGEVDGMTAHKIGVELAKRMWGDRFEVMVSTHMNTGTVHNHFCLNSVSFADGKKYYSGKALNRKLREVSDALCREYGLSVIAHPAGQTNREIGNRHREENGLFTWRSQIRKDMDEAIARNTVWRYFADDLQSRGYTLEWRGKYLRIRPDGAGKFFRLDRLGEGYTVEDVRTRLEENWSKPRPFFQPYHKPTHEKPRGLYALYLHFCYLLGELPKTYPKREEDNVELREAAKRMKQYSAEADLLGRNRIETAGDLHDFTERISTEFETLLMTRGKLRNRLRRMHDTKAMNPIRTEISELSERIRTLRREMVLCRDIAERSDAVEALVDRIEEVDERARANSIKQEEQEQEQEEKDEHIR